MNEWSNQAQVLYDNLILMLNQNIDEVEREKVIEALDDLVCRLKDEWFYGCVYETK